MHLSVPPTQLTVEYAENYLVKGITPREESETFSWKSILDEEPFEGQHWEGVYGLPPGSTVEGWETKSLDSTPPFSPLLLDDFGAVSPLSSTDSLPAASEAEPSMDLNADSVHVSSGSTFGHRQLIEDFQRRQYWRAEWQTDASLTRPFTVKDASSLGMLSGHHGEMRLADFSCRPVGRPDPRCRLPVPVPNCQLHHSHKSCYLLTFFNYSNISTNTTRCVRC